MIEQATTLNPNLSTLRLVSGWIRTYLSESEIAIEHLARAMRLNPFVPQAFVTHFGDGVRSFHSRSLRGVDLMGGKGISGTASFRRFGTRRRS
jgi:hypothetical protein